MPTDLLINIDHVATLRNARRETIPDPVHAAVAAETAGADGVVFHLREDRRHITERDVRLLKHVVRTKLDFELSTNPDVVRICCEVQPDLATLVPERREEVTTEGGLNVVGGQERLRDAVTQLREAGIGEVALFVDPVRKEIDATRETGADCIELHTGDFANAKSQEERARCAATLGPAPPNTPMPLALSYTPAMGWTTATTPCFGPPCPISARFPSALPSWRGPSWWEWNKPSGKCGRW